MRLLNSVFSTFDRLAELHGAEKIKTIGDAYMAALGIPEPRADHAEAAARMALAMLASLDTLKDDTKVPVSIRIGLHCGPVVAGVIGERKFAYDVWGNTVNVASRPGIARSAGAHSRHGADGGAAIAALHLRATRGDRLEGRWDGPDVSAAGRVAAVPDA